ncbi:unnamed protein product [Protopolystoma xenopodis]|uniref:Uncharacterized protein n=1 Tax=Protopolystoma xenopodis TaxID=117903 RepID=A0A448WVM6_9PLAT|nr:unnamed protein product [Protopolystoma xenopodis]
MVYRVIPETPEIESFLDDCVSRVISIGVGPGPDVAALVAYLRLRKTFVPGTSNRLVYYAIDKCSGWSVYLDAFDRAWSAVHGVSVWFRTARFGEATDVAKLPDADLIVFSFANTTLMSSTVWPALQARYRMIFVLDGMKEVCYWGKDRLNTWLNCVNFVSRLAC